MTDAVFVLDPLPADEIVELAGPEGRHAAVVRRIGVGERVVLTDGRGRRRSGVVAHVERASLSVRCGPVSIVPEPSPRLVVVQALAKGERAELAVELMTELGVDEIVPWGAARSIVRWQGDRGERGLERWRRIAVEAGKQSRRARFPTVADLASTDDVVARISAASAALVLHEEAPTSLVEVTLPADDVVLIVVGPEGGIAPAELDRFVATGAAVVRLGEPVLRTSTAGAAALAALSVRLGRWS